MIASLTRFVEELRAIGIPVSMVEVLDAAEALPHTDFSDPAALRASLGATLIKSGHHQRAFDVAFEVFFGLAPRPEGAAEEGDGPDPASEGAGATADGAGVDELLVALTDALAGGDREALLRLVRMAVARYAGMEPGRPVGGRYYLHRVMRRLDTDELRSLLTARVAADADALPERFADDEVERLVEAVRTEVRREILRRLVDDRGAEAVARTVRVKLVEDIDLMHATREELADIERAVAPLARKLATRLARRRRRGRRGRLDVRRTIRRSLAHGGVLLEPQFRPPRPSKPEIVLLCDVSGSMATFARFTMQLTQAIGTEFSRVRSFAFIDGVDEVTRFFEGDPDFHEALVTMNAEADLVRYDGHSDYGNALGDFVERYLGAVTPRTSVIVTGDARNNYRETGAWHLEEIAGRARALLWLNPEARRYWDTGDSVMSAYAPSCDSIDQVRSLRQLEDFVERVALPTTSRAVTAVV